MGFGALRASAQGIDSCRVRLQVGQCVQLDWRLPTRLDSSNSLRDVLETRTHWVLEWAAQTRAYFSRVLEETVPVPRPRKTSRTSDDSKPNEQVQNGGVVCVQFGAGERAHWVRTGAIAVPAGGRLQSGRNQLGGPCATNALRTVGAHLFRDARARLPLLSIVRELKLSPLHHREVLPQRTQVL